MHRRSRRCPERERSTGSIHALGHRRVDGASDPRRQGDHRLGPFPDHRHGAVAALGAQVFDVDAARLGDPQAEQAEETGEGMVDGSRGGRLGQERARGPGALFRASSQGAAAVLQIGVG